MQSIDINTQYIYEKVTTLTGTLGRQRDAYDKFVCLPDNYAALDRFMDTAIAVVEASLWRKLSDSHNLSLQWDKHQNLAIQIKNDSFPQRLFGVLSTNIRLAMAYLLAGMWLQGIEVELYAHYAKLSDSFINTASEVASQKDFKNIEYAQANPDNVPSAAAGSEGVGYPKREDCHINKHSRFDNATYWPDGSVMSY